MRFLEKICRAIFGNQPKSPLTALFRNERDAEKAIAVEETCFPYGGVTTLIWWKSKSAEFHRKTFKKFGESDTGSACKHSVPSGSENVEAMLEIVNGFEPSKGYSGNVRDGIIYCIAWGTRDQQRTLSISNPPADSRHFQLVAQLKNFALKDAQCSEVD